MYCLQKTDTHGNGNVGPPPPPQFRNYLGDDLSAPFLRAGCHYTYVQGGGQRQSLIDSTHAQSSIVATNQRVESFHKANSEFVRHSRDN